MIYFEVYYKNDVVFIMNKMFSMENDQLTQNRVENNSFTACQNAQNRD